MDRARVERGRRRAERRAPRMNRVAWLDAAAVGVALVAAAIVALRNVRRRRPAAARCSSRSRHRERDVRDPSAGGTGVARNWRFPLTAERRVRRGSQTPTACGCGRSAARSRGDSGNRRRARFRSGRPTAGHRVLRRRQAEESVDGGRNRRSSATDTPASRSWAWSRDNVILFSSDLGAGLLRVIERGGIPSDEDARSRDRRESNHRFPYFLPDGRHFVLHGIDRHLLPCTKPGESDRIARFSRTRCYLFESGVRRDLSVRSSVFVRDNTLMAQAFNLRTRQPSGRRLSTGRARHPAPRAAG